MTKQLFFRSDGRIINYRGNFDGLLKTMRDEPEQFRKLRHAETLLEILLHTLTYAAWQTSLPVKKLHATPQKIAYIIRKLRIASNNPTITVKDTELSNEKFILSAEYKINEDYSIGPIIYNIKIKDSYISTEIEIDFDIGINEVSVWMREWGSLNYECDKIDAIKIYHDLIRKYKEFDKDAEKLKEYFNKTYLPKFKD